MRELQDFLKSDLHALDILIAKTLKETRVPLIIEMSQYLINAGGKRLRPLLTFLCHRLYDDSSSKRVIRLGACIEFIHTATLLHDDVIDESTERRGKPAAHTLWGNDASVLVGDFLFSRAFELMVEDEDINVFRILSQTASQISEGELLQLTHSGSMDLSTEIYLDIIKAKTAALFSAAFELGGITAHVPLETQEILKSIGNTLGILYQIGDDMLDFGLSHGDLGKATGNDLMEGKMTLPLILTHQSVLKDKKTEVESIFQNPTPQALEHLKYLMDELDIETQCLAFAEPLKASALNQLKNLPDSNARRLLEKLLDFSLTRLWNQ